MANTASPVCPLCEGSGWKPVAAAGPASRGGTRRVTRCDCMAGARTQRLLETARVPARYEHCELTNFDPPRGPHFEPLSNARLQAGRFVEEYPVEKTGLLLVGPIGVGKTHLAVGILKELISSKGIPCLFYDYRELLKEIQNSYNASVQTTELEV
ncbi:MAG: ATP-binding protein, partial [Terriglobales bacterium]